MKNTSYIEKFLLGSEKVICTAKQSPRLLFWSIKHFVIFLVAMGLPIGVFLFLPFIPNAWRDFVNANQYIYYIYAGIAGLWLIALIVRLFINISNLSPYTAFLTTKRVLIVHKNKITTVLFGSVISVAMQNDPDENYKKCASIEIHTASTIYKLDRMKNGNKLIDMLAKILFGGTIKITTTEEETITNLAQNDSTSVETKTEEHIKPAFGVKNPKTIVQKTSTQELDATDKLIKKTQDTVVTKTEVQANTKDVNNK